MATWTPFSQNPNTDENPMDAVKRTYMHTFERLRFFIEVQKTVYCVKQMQEKLERYVLLYESGIIDKPFPHVLILSDQRYAIDENYPFKVFQSETFTEFVASLKSAPVSKPSERGVRIVVK